ncbi:hypothetical protein Tco_0533005 [Tanacetum coccineum]
MEYLHEKFRHYHHHHHRVDEMTCLDDGETEKIRMKLPCHDHFRGREFGLGPEDARLDQQCKMPCQDEAMFP